MCRTCALSPPPTTGQGNSSACGELLRAAKCGSIGAIGQVLALDNASSVRVRVIPVGPLSCNCVLISTCCGCSFRCGSTARRQSLTGEAPAATGTCGDDCDSSSTVEGEVPFESHERCKRPTIVIDPGGDSSLILAAIAEDDLDVTAILVTHGHIDHFLGAGLLQKALGPSVEVHMSPKDAWLWAAWPAQCEMMGLRAVDSNLLPDGPDAELSDDQEFLLPLASRDGAAVMARIVCTPGHTPGSVCVWVPKLRLVCTGDTLFCGSIGRTDLPGSDSSAILRSIHERVLPLVEEVKGCDDASPTTVTVVPGHGALTSLGHERETNPFLQSRTQRSRL